jgi:hypothetical protein
VRYARNSGNLRKADHEHNLTIAWINASLQRSKKMPSLKTLLKPTRRKPTLADIVEKLNQP